MGLLKYLVNDLRFRERNKNASLRRIAFFMERVIKEKDKHLQAYRLKLFTQTLLQNLVKFFGNQHSNQNYFGGYK